MTDASPSTAAAPSEGPRRSSPAPGRPRPTGSGCASSATPPRWRRCEAIDGVELVAGRRGDHQRRRARRRGALAGPRPRSCSPPTTSPRAAPQAMASAGSTGATMTAALFALRRMHGVRRPALAVQLARARPARPADAAARRRRQRRGPGQSTWSSSPTSAPPSARPCSGSPQPRVALLSVGEEAKKGTAEVVEAHAQARRARQGLDFRGNVEGRDLLAGAADVIVTDGFTGNVVLKTIEGTARTVADAVRAAARSGPAAAAGGLLLRPALGGLRRQLDPDTTGGAILLGPARRRRGRPRQLRAGGDRQRGAARGARGRGAGGRAHRRAPGGVRDDPRRAAP